MGSGEVGVEFAPVGYGGHDAHGDYFVAEGAEVLVALLKFFFFGGCAADGLHFDTILADGSLHGHHDV